MKRLESFMIVLALSFYVWFLKHFGFKQIIDYVWAAGWGLLLTISLESVARVANTIGWRATLCHGQRDLSFFQMLAARIAGEAIDYVTPSAQLGGDFLMATMVRHKLSMPHGLASVVLAELAQSIGQIIFLIVALLLSLRLEFRLGDISWLVLFGLIVTVGLPIAFLLVQLRRPFSHLWRAADRLGLTFMREAQSRLAAAQADALLLDFYAHRRVYLLVSSAWFLVGWAMGPVELYILLKLLHQSAPWQAVLLIEAVGMLIERVTFVIPAKLVSQEGGKALILAMLGYPAGVGFAIGFLRRIKELVWVMFGLAVLTAHRFITERAVGPAQSEAEHQSHSTSVVRTIPNSSISSRRDAFPRHPQDVDGVQ
jgi:uncharacterized membrane protein YbhN (UPF0104 family)